ncbi:DNA/RNA non-specific endonuclease [Exiguobacterium sp. B2(2022)]|uniref:DNA/RNA non-specific endonuclease n=1 Tax=Exiguobacterium sp. B2(2022) TaxID=2992755 RepID=UPI00237C1E31|nr:DNA/RNA non-specific endonuclease [Exiguobacterium sp. B2(2022)]MDE0562161.1 DNA/RNA non-specific endonuclease [Exiguobacterium sp. B2(2022)]
MKRMPFYIPFLLGVLLLSGCTDADVSVPTSTEETVEEEPAQEERTTETPSPEQEEDLFEGYTQIEVDGGDQAGRREANVVVDIGFGDREYWAFTNEHGQLIRVIADEITLQDDETEDVNSSGRYYSDEAKVPGVEDPNLDEGHIIADSLGGVSNAYNITPQNSALNRYGDQAFMEDVIRKAGGAKDFEAIITYPNTTTQIPSRYQYTYTVRGNTVTDTYDNADPEEVNESLDLTDDSPPDVTTDPVEERELSDIDVDGNGQVTIKEAKNAGFEMPITRDHWLYQYMDDRDGDGMVGE